MTLRVIIADDEPTSRERLRNLLEGESSVKIVAECSDGHSALSAIRQHAPDLVFLDVRMPELSGFEVIRGLAPLPIPPIIFVSAHVDHAAEAFDFCAVDYLLKPFDRGRFRKALLIGREAAARRANEVSDGLPEASSQQVFQDGTKERLAVRSVGKITLLTVSEISLIKGAGNYVEVYAGKAVHLLRGTLSGIEKKLPANFVRVSKSHIVNIEGVRELKPKSHGDSFLTLLNGSQLIVTRTYRQALRDKLSL